jgi:tRNA threonylcarbamoyladenosine biosynthesis protein TsaB
LPLILQIETATDFCSVALASDGQTVALINDPVVRNHASGLLPAIHKLFEKASLKIDNLDAVAVSKGPGSYTGLRIGVATAKGICFATGKPLIAVNTLESMATWYSTLHPENESLICPMIDARRMEVYTALFSKNIETIEATTALILDDSSFGKQLQQQSIVFIGNGAEKFEKLLIESRNALFISDLNADARGMNQLALDFFRDERFESLAYFEPFYLKDFYMPPKKSN